MLKLALSVDDSGAVARSVIDRALAGDRVALRLCFEAIMPKARARTVELDLPVCDSVENVVAALDVTVAAMAAGEITPDEALTVTRVLDRRRRALGARTRRQTVAAAAEAADHVAAETPAVVPSPEPGGGDLHFSCKNSESATPGEAEEAGNVEIVAPRPPLPMFGSACIPPAISRRASRRAEPIGAGAAADHLHFACTVGRENGARAADGEGAVIAADAPPLVRPPFGSCISPAFSRPAYPGAPPAIAPAP
jgi:hypothetical protein